jgi:hypothetical protein
MSHPSTSISKLNYACEIVLAAAKVKERVEIVHPGPGSGLLVPHQMRHLVLLPSQPRQWVVSAPTGQLSYVQHIVDNGIYKKPPLNLQLLCDGMITLTLV